MWFRRAKPLIGIDIGSHAIKLVRFGRVGAECQLRNVALLPIPPEAVADGVIVHPEAVQRGLRQLMALEKTAEKAVALALSGHSVIVKKVQMVRMSEAELANAMPYEAGQHIPFEVYDVNTDFQILDPPERGHGQGGQMDVVLVAAKKERVDELGRVAQSANLHPVVIDVDMLALINCFELNYPQDMSGHVVSLVHIGASMMTVLILKDGLNAFQRDIPLGGNQYTAALQKAFALDRDDAEAIKLGARPAQQPQAEVLAVLRRVTEDAVTEIQRSFEFYLASVGDESIEKLYLSGGCARMNGLCPVLTSRLKLPVERFEPFRRVHIPEKHFDIDYVHDVGPMMAVAAGLALRQRGER
jgi:type IV pilus assembly protein PilM